MMRMNIRPCLWTVPKKQLKDELRLSIRKKWRRYLPHSKLLRSKWSRKGLFYLVIMIIF
ncbi:hypothetical protein ANCDUO_16732 [Ancylostoma duodenale]|uniref:Uncharacterized protein n=1 Tax=Ancylostoma duodenale TaxID=51022 RepID=A0A0C2CTL6_9BILA|nr:hypothetical protein ANCDUO_16732 [Ancylostoma duodenale]